MFAPMTQPRNPMQAVTQSVQVPLATQKPYATASMQHAASPMQYAASPMQYGTAFTPMLPQYTAPQKLQQQP